MEESIPLLQTHQIVFSWIHQKFGRLIHKALIEDPRQLRSEYFDLLVGRVLAGNDGHQLYRRYLTVLEDRMEPILRQHSVYFWLHLYRRIGVSLSPDHDKKTDLSTVLLVREIVEVAITKFGRLDRTGDISVTSNLDIAWGRSGPQNLHNDVRCSRLARGGNRHGKEKTILG